MSFEQGRTYLALPGAPNRWVVDQVLPTSGLLNIFGPPKSGKTFAALDLAIAISDPARTAFLDWTVHTHGPVWYLQIDTPRRDFQDRIKGAVTLGADITHLYMADQQMVPYPYNILGEGKLWLRKAIDGAFQAHGKEGMPVALFIDTLRDAHGADENDSGVMRNVVTSFVDAVKPPPVRDGMASAWEMPALVFVTHGKKFQEGQTPDLMSGNRGSNYLAGRMDTVMQVANGDIKAQSRSMGEIILMNYRRNEFGFWVKFDINAEVKKYLDMPFRSENARHEAFHEKWKSTKLSLSSVKNYFRNVLERGSYDAYPPKKS